MSLRICGLLLVAVLPFASCSQGADKVTPSQSAALVRAGEAADLVVIATRTGETSAFTDPPTTTYIVQVESTLKGAGEKLLPIRQVGFFRDSKTIPEAAPHLEKERPYLLFLRKLPQSNAYEIVEGSYYAVEATKGTLVSNVETLPSWVDIEALRRRLRAPNT